MKQKSARQRSLDRYGRLKKTIMYEDISGLTYDQWVAKRREYIGGSDVPTMLGLNPYQSKLELFHEKIGIIKKTGKEDFVTYSGHKLEDYIIDNYWIYYNPTYPDIANTIDNAVKGHKIRHAKRIKNALMYDPRLPMCRINTDALIQKTRHQKRVQGVLEIKSGLSWIWNQYESGIPIFYIIQLQTYLMVTGLKRGEIAVLLDGRYFEVFEIKESPEIQDKIRKEIKEFWDLVEEGRYIWEDDSLDESEKLQLISEIEPPAEGTKALDSYLKERFRSEYKAGKLAITDEITNLATEYLECNEQIAKITEQKLTCSNMLKKIFLDNRVDEIISPDDQVLITHRKSAEGKDPVLRVNKRRMQEYIEGEEQTFIQKDETFE